MTCQIQRTGTDIIDVMNLFQKMFPWYPVSYLRTTLPDGSTHGQYKITVVPDTVSHVAYHCVREDQGTASKFIDQVKQKMNKVLNIPSWNQY